MTLDEIAQLAMDPDCPVLAIHEPTGLLALLIPTGAGVVFIPLFEPREPEGLYLPVTRH